MTSAVLAIARSFHVEGEWEFAERIPSGHINETYRVICVVGGQSRRFTLQKINRSVFRDPEALMDNIARVTRHLQLRHTLQSVAQPGPGISRISRHPQPVHTLQSVHRASAGARLETLTLVPAVDGQPYHRDEQGEYWRMYVFIEHAHTVDAVSSEAEAAEAARAFGQFQLMLADLPPPPLHVTIPDFHHTPRRFEQLERAIEADTLNRAREVQDDIAFARDRMELGRLLVDMQARGELPLRTTHNDTKINNLLFDDATGRAVCVVDLDTVMPGLSLHDFGDLVRTASCTAAEDERDLTRVRVEPKLFEPLVRGYLEAAGGMLTPLEKQHLVDAGKIITLETGVRFLADHLEGDRYFRIHRPGHNLDRCRAQFALLRSIEKQESALRRLAASN
jgi:Ser/Thr protein kinase RdoA (MazF antagonist)